MLNKGFNIGLVQNKESKQMIPEVFMCCCWQQLPVDVSEIKEMFL